MLRRRRAFCSLLLLALPALPALLALPAAGGEGRTVDGAVATITEKELREHVAFIASDELAGRAAGTPECRRAAEYLRRELRACGLKPLGDKPPEGEARDYFQALEVVVATRLAAGGKGNILALGSAGGAETFTVEKQFMPLTDSADSAAVKDREVVFVGYGITDRKTGYDDYARVKVKGKVVVMFRYDHGESRPGVYKPGAGAWTSNKIRNAVAHGAAGVIIVNGPNSRRAGKSDPLTALGRGARKRLTNDKVPVVHAKRVFLEELFAGRDEKPADLQKMMDKLKQPGSIPLKGKTVSLAVSLVRVKKPTRNVIAFLPGRDEKLKHEYVVVGAHYDHVGLGEWGSRWGKRGRGKIHNGANDNGSGVAAVLEVAEAAAGLARRPRRSIVFVFFTAEERGLAGSRHFISNFPAPEGRIAVMLNADMVGRTLKPGQLHLCGAASSPVFKKLIARENAKLKLAITVHDAAYASSDHVAFLAAKIPALFYFAGFDSDYHTPDDDAEKLNYPDHTRISRHLLRTALALAEMKGPIAFQDAAPRRRGARLGIKPDPEKSSTVAEVLPGTPAAEAGIKKGDLIVEMNGKMITGVVDIYRALLNVKPGDVVKVKVLRNTADGDEFLELPVKF